MSAELSSHTVLFGTQSNTEFMGRFRTVGQMAFYFTRLMEGYLCGHKNSIDIFVQVAPIYLVPGEGAIAFRKPAPYSDGCEGVPRAASLK